ncbi:MAG: DNA-processing protein DprA [Oscillospiraceae bacterium]|nr:DNA-processing protein DprA [Oscillospiraceae bacterium]
MLLYWIWLAELKDITLLQKQRLLERFHDPEELYHTADGVFQKLGLPEKERQALQNRDLKAAEQILLRCTEKDIKLLPLTDRAYPTRLRNTPDAPILLYYRGILPDWEGVPFIGVVGTRKASAYGLQVAHQMGGQIAAGGGHIVSGGAAGGDTAAMQGALEAGCPVVGVLGCGVDVVYPRSNCRLFDAVVENGCLISEYPPGAPPIDWHFPARNRIISGISNGVLVVEAPVKSGALITAQRALEQGRDVFVVPGNINIPTCAGSNALLQEGATPVFTGWDVLSGYEFLYPGKLRKSQFASLYTGEPTEAKVAQKLLTPEKTSKKPAIFEKKPIDNGRNTTYIELDNNHPALSDTEQAVLALLTRVPQEPAELIAKLDLPSGKVLSSLTMLTVKGLVHKHPGGRVSLK